MQLKLKKKITSPQTKGMGLDFKQMNFADFYTTPVGIHFPPPHSKPGNMKKKRKKEKKGGGYLLIHMKKLKTWL